MKEKRCINPHCANATLIRMDLESTWTLEKFFCPNAKCGRIYVVPTITGKITQVAPLASMGIFAVSLLTMDWETAVEHAADHLV